MGNEGGTDMSDKNLKQTLQKVQKEKTANKSDKRLIGGHFTPEVQQQVRVIAATQDTTIQALLTEALNDLFEKQGYPRIAE